MTVRRVRRGARRLLVLLAAGTPLAGARAAEPLPALEVQLAASSVSGLSSGAYMAGQFHVAFSELLVGAGIVAGGPYDCAEGQLAVALNRCMDTTLGVPDPAQLHRKAETLAADGRIDPLSGLQGDRVYLFAGTADETVAPAVVAQAVAFYRLAGLPEAAIAWVDELPAGHGFVTEDEGNACGVTESPFVNDCDYDQAGALLEQVYGPLQPPAAALSGTLVAFDQTEFLPEATRHGMATTGFVYLPARCAEGAVCRVHVAFHGCRQTAGLVGNAFVDGAGYNRWADSNRLIVLYPQAHETPLNPNACWDWWGYDDPDYMTRSGRQMAAVRAMLARLAGESAPPTAFCAVHAGYNFSHWQAGRASFCDWWSLCAVGSGENLGFWGNRATLYESPAGRFSTTPCEG
ncbi:MAG TPA: PHB depolymerase family esterase [Geminicoccaceae bacterium]|nr:PHB depolymerase family esterase [Geminicoccaceae bacterium]